MRRPHFLSLTDVFGVPLLLAGPVLFSAVCPTRLHAPLGCRQISWLFLGRTISHGPIIDRNTFLEPRQASER
ncbi:hypothetical protein EDB87DRAFT_1611998 [Lactarius vividus]|nr:hypothetical protein EDB87DRAFT_1611998 [Lactarius vividus]